MLVAIAFALIAQQVSPPDEPVRGRKLDMTTVDVDGKLATPTIGVVYARPKTKFKNLIELRANFRPELTKSREHM